jgi:LPXTG-motif cell wall-anchored protein
MNRLIATAAIGLATVAAALSVPSAAGAAPTSSAAPGPISATAEPINFDGDPWAPSGTLSVTVHNGSGRAVRGHFLLEVPMSAHLVDREHCRLSEDDDYTFVCGGALLEAGADKTYRMQVRSDLDGVQFDTSIRGRVVGIELGGERGVPADFAINWPRKVPLRLAAAEGSTVGRRTTVEATVTNAGEFAIGGYSLGVRLPKGAKTVGANACKNVIRFDGPICELYRGKGLKAGAVDTFTLTTDVVGGPKKITFYLAPVERYPNKDTSVTLTLGAGTPSATATPTAVPTAPVTSAPGAGGADELPKTGVDAVILAVAGAGVLGLGALLLVIARRRRITFS